MKRQMSFEKEVPTLYLVATPIGNLNEVSSRTLEVLKSVSLIACEDTRNTKKLLSHFEIEARLLAYHNFNEEESAKGLLKILEKESVALVSDAGYPLLSDPGYTIVSKASALGIPVVTISGPNAAINALVASGLDSRHYLFYGFLNAKNTICKKELEALKAFPYTLIFYEAPHRILKTVENCLEVLGDRKAVIARELTKLHEEYIRGTLSEFLTLEDLKGEIVLLIEGNPQVEEEVDWEVLKEKVDERVKEGYKVKEAIQSIAKEHHVSKNELYQFYHQK